MYLVFYREGRGEDEMWHQDTIVDPESKTEAMKKYAMRVKDYGRHNCIISETLAITCLVVEVLFDGETVSSQ